MEHKDGFFDGCALKKTLWLAINIPPDCFWAATLWKHFSIAS
jgi:hypothetical protein